MNQKEITKSYRKYFTLQPHDNLQQRFSCGCMGNNERFFQSYLDSIDWCTIAKEVFSCTVFATVLFAISLTAVWMSVFLIITTN